MEHNITPSELWTLILAVASALVLLAQAIKAITEAVKAIKAPNQKQNERLDGIDEWRRKVDDKLDRDNTRLVSIEEGSRATQRALLALLDHGIDGNNVKQMHDAKEELQNHLINK